MRLAVISDIHGNVLALEAVLNDLKNVGSVDRTWVLGDLVAFGPRPAECIQAVRDLSQTDVISGNTDRYLVTGDRTPFGVKDEADWTAMPARLRRREASFMWTMEQLSFPQYEYLSRLRGGLDVNVAGYGWVIGYHGAPGNDEPLLLPDTPADEILDYFLDFEGRLGFGGHTHIPMVREVGRWQIVNVGSVGMPRNDPRACYAVVSFEQGKADIRLRRVDYDGDAVLADLQQRGTPYIEEPFRLLTGKDQG